VDFTWRVSDCEELVGEVNHTTECVTNFFSFVDVEWGILRTNSKYLVMVFLKMRFHRDGHSLMEK
jgi:hypothetical protein